MFSRLFLNARKARDKAKNSATAKVAKERKAEVEAKKNEKPDYKSINPIYYRTSYGIQKCLSDHSFKLSDISWMRRNFTMDLKKAGLSAEVINESIGGVVIKGTLLLARDGSIYKIINNHKRLPIVMTPEEFYYLTHQKVVISQVRIPRKKADKLYNLL